MGLIDGAMGNIINRTKDQLSYKAGDVVSGAAIGGASKFAEKIKGDKGSNKPLDKCPKCKTKLEADAKFCPSCGQALTVNCSKCNIAYPIGTKFCKQCGGKLS